MKSNSSLLAFQRFHGDSMHWDSITEDACRPPDSSREPPCFMVHRAEPRASSTAADLNENGRVGGTETPRLCTLLVLMSGLCRGLGWWEKLSGWLAVLHGGG